MLIHRPFIPLVGKSALKQTLPSLAICASAARACANMADLQRQRKRNVPVVFNLPAVLTSGIVLLLNVWSGRRTGLVSESNREMANVHKCMEVLRLCEDRWQVAGRDWDVLAELASAGQLPLPSQAQTDATSRSSTLPIPPDQHKPSVYMSGSHSFQKTFEPPTDTALFESYGPGPSSFNSQLSNPSTFRPASAEPSNLGPQPALGNPFSEIYPHPAQASHELDSMLNLIDSDMIAVWANALDSRWMIGERAYE
ncbi:hypothetical protein C8R43DRAFT_350588 [Mycena crocata]|nr:hypothetical protein C8R43DRAFT_350588 [Mycena crocata]